MLPVQGRAFSRRKCYLFSGRNDSHCGSGNVVYASRARSRVSELLSRLAPALGSSQAGLHFSTFFLAAGTMLQRYYKLILGTAPSPPFLFGGVYSTPRKRRYKKSVKRMCMCIGASAFDANRKK